MFSAHMPDNTFYNYGRGVVEQDIRMFAFDFRMPGYLKFLSEQSAYGGFILRIALRI